MTGYAVCVIYIRKIPNLLKAQSYFVCSTLRLFDCSTSFRNSEIDPYGENRNFGTSGEDIETTEAEMLAAMD